MSAPTFDYIVVGAGSAGCALAAKLSETGRHSVLLLESGKDDPWIWTRVPLGVGKILRSTRAHRRYFTEPEPGVNGRRIFWPRGHAVGGSSAINGLIWVRGDPKEYDQWREQGLAGWGYEDVAPHFRAIERCGSGDDAVRGRHGPIHIAEYSDKDPLSEAFLLACQQAGIPANRDYNGREMEGVGYLQLNTRRGVRHGTRDAYIRPARGRPNLHICTEALATRIITSGNKALGVEYMVDGQRRTAMANRETVISAGAIQSPQLLELSGIGNPEILRRHGIPVVCALEGVGENCRDHLNTRINYRCNRPITLNDKLNNPLRKIALGLQYIVRREGMMAASTCSVHALAKSDAGLNRPDVKIMLHHLSSEDARNPKKWKWDDFPGFSIGTFMLRPRSSGRVHITTSDPTQAPAMTAGYLDDEYDRATGIAALRLARQVADQPALRKIIVNETRPGPDVRSDEELLAYMRRSGTTSYHPIGTCKMGAEGDPTAVVDARLRVRGVHALRVADASIMPTMVSSNTNAPSIMIGEKAAAMMLEDLA